MISARQHRRFSLEEYLRVEREAAGERSEFVSGEILAMTGGSIRHAKVILNLGIALGVRLRGKPCQPFSSDLRLLVKDSALVTYPDLMVLCGPPEFHQPGPKDTLLNPTAIFEVLSPSTQSFDRGDKAAAYRTMTSLKHLVLVAQDAPSADVYTRSHEGQWRFSELTELDAMLDLEALGVGFPLSELYRDLPAE